MKRTGSDPQKEYSKKGKVMWFVVKGESFAYLQFW